MVQRDAVQWARSLVRFVIAWLIALYVYQVVHEVMHALKGPAGLAAGALTVALNLYARRRATRCVPASFAFKFWLYLPVGVFLLVPPIIKMVAYLTADGERSWWSHLVSLLPFLVELGIPVAVLLWAYAVLGTLGGRDGDAVDATGTGATETEADAPGDSGAAATP